MTLSRSVVYRSQEFTLLALNGCVRFVLPVTRLTASPYLCDILLFVALAFRLFRLLVNS